MSGLFITFEGGEGCGKSTQIKLLAKQLENQGYSVTTLREPGGTDLGEAIRNLLQHDAAGEGMVPEAELLLFAASRAQLTRQRIIPAIKAGQIVLCDRFMDSTTVYQGVARQLDSNEVAQINAFAVGDTQPDLTILIDLPPEIGMKRVKARSNGELDRMEKEAETFFNAVRKGYLQLAKTAKDRFLKIEGQATVDQIASQIWSEVSVKLTKD